MKKLTELWTKVSTYIKKYGWLALVLMIVIVFALQKCRINKLKDANQLQSVTLSTLNDSVSVFKDKNKNLTFKIAAVEVDAGNKKKALEEAGFVIKDLKDRNIKWRDITIALQAKLEASNQGTITLHDTTFVFNTDTVTGLIGSWSDDYLSLYPYILQKEMKFRYTYGTGINFDVAKNGKESVVSVYLTNPNDRKVSNPYAKITTANSIVIKRRTYFWEKPWITIPAGIVGGILIMKL